MSAIESTTDAKNGQQLVQTDHYGLGGDASLVHHTHIAWDANLIATITIWSSDFPDVLVTSTDAKDWCQEDPPTGYTAISPGGSATAAPPLTLAIAGGTAGCASMNLWMFGARRLKAKVVATQQGYLRIRANGKD